MTRAMRTDTAHLDWDERWKTSDGRAAWLTPEPDVVEWATHARRDGALRALDIGCGVGRHALMLARLGFETSALDGSAAGVAHLGETARREGLTIDARQGLMTDLPYESSSFDYVLSFNVIYHGDGPVVRRTIEEIRRVLRPRGLYQGTMLSKRDVTRLEGREIAPDTFVGSGPGDKDHPHYYCDARELVGVFDGFELLSLVDRVHARTGSWHWHLVAERL